MDLDDIEKNKIGILQASAYCLGDIVGAGIFVTPSSILRYSGSIGLSICIWVLSALISGIAALVYVELGTSIRKSGSDFAYLTHAKWRPVAVAFLYSMVAFARPTVLAIQTLSFGEYIVEGLNRTMCVSHEWQPLMARLLGLVALFLIAFVNLFSLNKSAARFQMIATASKLLVIVVIMFTGFYILIFKGGSALFNDSFKSSATNPGDIVLGLYAGLYAYNGWDILNYGTEEIKNPKRTLPIAACCGIIGAAVIFVAMNVAYFSTMTPEQFLKSNAVAVKFAEISLGRFSYAVPFLIGLLLLGNLNTTLFANSRNLLAGANENVAPGFLRCVHVESMSPRAAVLVESFIGGAILFLGDLEQLITYMAFALWLQRAFTLAALLYMRFAGFVFPKDAFRTPIVVPACVLIICVSLLFISASANPFIVVYGGSMVMVGIVIYFIFILPQQLPSIFYRINDWLVKLTQILLNSMPLPVKSE